MLKNNKVKIKYKTQKDGTVTSEEIFTGVEYSTESDDDIKNNILNEMIIENKSSKFISNDPDEITKYLGNDIPRPDGHHLLVKVYTDESISAGGILIPEEIRARSASLSMVGLVLSMGPDCYMPEKFKNWNRRSIGDWVVFVPNEGTLFYCKDLPLRFIPDDRIYCKVDHPEFIKRT